MLLNCNCAELANCENFLTCRLLRESFFVDTVYIWDFLAHIHCVHEKNGPLSMLKNFQN